jgi:uncharacterized membrane protein
MSKLLENPALLVGLIRAAMIFAVSLGVGITQPQQDSLLELVGAFLAVASLVLTGVTLRTTTPSANPTLDVGTVVTTPGGAPAAVKLI